jgi:hypothetical protein
LVGQELEHITRFFRLNDFIAQLWRLNEKGVNKVCQDNSSYTIVAILMKLYGID